MPQSKLEEVVLGNVYRDSITGFQGVAISCTTFLYACKRVGLQPTELKDGKLIDAHYFDIYQLTEVEVPSPANKAKKDATTGGPGDCAKQNECPRR